MKNESRSLKPIQEMTEEEVRREAIKQRSLLKQLVARLYRIESENEFYKGTTRAAEGYIAYFMDSLMLELDLPEDHEFKIAKEDLTKMLTTKEIEWKEDKDRKEVVIKIQDRKEPENEGNLSGEDTATTTNQEEQSADQI